MIQKGIFQSLDGIVNDIMHQLQAVRAIILFGSYAEGNPGSNSDIGILVLVDHPDYGDFEVSHHPLNDKAVELTLVSLEIFQQEIKEGNPFVLSILRYGIVLHDDGCFEELKNTALTRPGDRFIFSQVAAARERFERGELRAAATYALNAQRLLENNLNLSLHLENLIGREIALDTQMVEQWVKEAEAEIYGEKLP